MWSLDPVIISISSNNNSLSSNTHKRAPSTPASAIVQAIFNKWLAIELRKSKDLILLEDLVLSGEKPISWDI